MNKGIIRVLSVFLTIILVAGVLYGCNKAHIPNEGIDTVVDANGVTYLKVEDEKDGHILAGFTDDKGNAYAAETDAAGNVLMDGPVYSFEYNGEWPTNDTTAVSVEQSRSETYNFAGNEVVNDPTGTTSGSVASTEESTTGTTEATTKKPDSGTTTKPGNKKDPKDKDKYLSSKYAKLFASGTYYVEFSTDSEDMPDTVTAAVKNGNIYMKTKLEGMNCVLIYQRAKENIYVVLTDYRIYCKMPPSMLDDIDMADFANSGADYTSVKVSDVTIGGKKCVRETYNFKDGTTSDYYFYNKELVRLDQRDEQGVPTVMNIIKVSSSVDDSLFELPKGYVPINLSKFNFDEEPSAKGE